MEYIFIFLAAILSGNYVLMRFLGICPFLGVSRQIETAAGMGAAVSFVLTLSSLICWVINRLILVPFGLEYLRTIAFILTIASLVQLVETAMKKVSPALYKALGIFLPLITTNCVILGAAIVNINEGYDLIATIMNSLGAAIGFAIAIILFASIRERLEIANVPKALEGFPVALVSAGLLAFAFNGFMGLV